MYSAWIEKLFDAPLDQSPSWKALHEVLRDPTRNFLFNHLGLREDEKKLVIQPDCADLPYFLRAYFAFKMGLPFGYSKCSRGGGGGAPKCSQWWNIKKEEPPPAPEQKVASGGFFFDQPMAAPVSKLPQRPKDLVPGFGFYVRTTVANGVHSGNGRTAAADDNTDYYPVPLTQDALRPGTIYADPYGHVLVLSKRIAQTDDAAGVFLAVDGQPDGTVARKRFWRGNFLFAQNPALGGPGFKRFRPIVADKSGGLRRLTNAEIGKDPQYGDFSLDQSKLGIEDFYDRMDDVMSPAPLDPMRALNEVDHRARGAGQDARDLGRERPQVPDRRRRGSRDAGRRVDLRDHRRLGGFRHALARSAPADRHRRGAHVPRPRGAAARTLRDAQGQERRRRQSGARAACSPPRSPTRKFTYTRTDGSTWKLALKDVIDRMARPRDGLQRQRLRRASLGRAGETRRGRDVQAARAGRAARPRWREYRAWFHERSRPARD